MNTFGERLKAAIEASGSSQTALAAAVHRTKSAVSQWVNFGVEPDYRTLAAICDHLGCSADYLVRGVDSPYLDERTAAVVNKIANLDAEQRAGVYSLILGRAVPDGEVERKMPITRQLRKRRHP